MGQVGIIRSGKYKDVFQYADGKIRVFTQSQDAFAAGQYDVKGSGKTLTEAQAEEAKSGNVEFILNNGIPSPYDVEQITGYLNHNGFALQKK